MKKLLLLRGAPASGKSTFIKDNNLEPYVISSDNLRLMVAGLSMDLDGNMKTSQDLDRKVWRFLGEILDERMRYGATTVIDATHNSTKSFKKIQTSCREIWLQSLLHYLHSTNQRTHGSQRGTSSLQSCTT